MKPTIAYLQRILLLCALCWAALPPQPGRAQNAWTDWWLNGPVETLDHDWRYYPIKGAKCRHGTDTGILVRLVENARKIVITFQGGGACFSGATCAGNVSEFDVDNARDAAAGTGLGTQLTKGIWRTDVSHELANYSQIFVPYCTGDLHAGNNVTYVNGVFNKQYFVGYNNAALYFRYIVERFVKHSNTPIDEVLLSGFSAGGFGAVLNAPQLRRVLPADVLMSVLDDSGPFFDNADGTLMRSCLQERWYDTWGLQRAVTDGGCANCTRGNWLNPFFASFLENHRNVPVAFMSSSNDTVIQAFMGYTNLFCGHDPDAAEYEQGLRDLRTQLRTVRAAEQNVASFFRGGSQQHCAIQNNTYFDYVTEEGDELRPWVERLTSDTGSHSASDYQHYGLLPLEAIP